MAKKIFQKASQEVYALATRALENWHPQLVAHNIHFELTTVSKLGEDDELVQCLKLHGTPCAAYVKLISTGDKVHVPHDVQIFIDFAYWDTLTENQRLAVLDHEFEHVVVRTDKAGLVMKDEQGRVKLKMRPDDFSLTGFFSVVERHKADAVECLSVTKVFEKIQQRLAESTQTNTTSTAVTIDVTEVLNPGCSIVTTD